MPISVIGSTERLEALYQPGDGDVLLVTFNGMGQKANGTDFAAAQVAAKLGMPALGIVSREANWFPEPDMRALLPSIQNYLDRHERRISYGFSMGGYGALKYSRMMGAEAVIALSPQTSIDPDFVPWEGRYRSHVRDFHRGERIRPEDIGGNLFVILDRLDESDNKHARVLSEICTPRCINAAGVGHHTHEIFLSSEVMGQLFALALAQDEQGIRRLVRARKRLLRDIGARLWTVRGRMLYRRLRHHQALSAAERALTYDADSADALLILAKSKISATKTDVELISKRVDSLLPADHWMRRELDEVARMAPR